MTESKNGSKSFTLILEVVKYVRLHPGLNQTTLAEILKINIATLNRAVKTAIKFEFIMVTNGTLHPGKAINPLWKPEN